MRRILLVLLAAVAGLTTVGAADGQAYRLGGKKWPTRTITYHSSAKQYEAAIREAVRGWNASGVNIRFKAVKRSSAKLHIIYRGRGLPAGDATLGWVPVQTWKTVNGLQIQGGQSLPCGFKIGKDRVKCDTHGPQVRLDKVPKNLLDEPIVPGAMVETVAHELGHVIGLAHHHSRCAVMSYKRAQRCPKPPVPWQYRCRVLERDDVKGALKRYGGSAKPLGTEFCDLYEPPAAPTALTATFDPETGVVVATWINGASPTVTGVAPAIKRGSCASSNGGMFQPASPGAPGTETFSVSKPGSYCVSAWSLDKNFNVGPSASFWVDVPPER